MIPLTIISGGQTGVDRGALDGALAEGFACGGWCPANRQAEDGIIPEYYPLTPLADAGYRWRTRQNVMDSDATVIIFYGEIRTPSGTALTLKTCIQKHKPHLLIDAWQMTPKQAAHMMVQFIHDHSVQILTLAVRVNQLHWEFNHLPNNRFG